ncbi:hypothetical protein CAL26_09270 [Bordetella genomosp. 9]|uniref:DUF1799 domain-containing protein n=1 Tax=Bordetella genomosp. 9 TaxID=1416803 RepID=A0A261RFB3_9BORD|nr:DUF1799 domain-containing protein [Bordetella genomosp. 9]OZI23621.1 hypothetical protein CAL26_09270 [Bordetella genomosp. 9]
MTLDDVAGPPVEVWPGHEEALSLFLSIRTQWRVGMAGATGLDYGVLFHKMDRMGLSPERYEELEEEVRIMENAALDEMSKK